MKAIAPDAGLGEITRQRKGLRDVRLAAMKRRIKAGNLRDMRRRIKDCADRRQVMRLMQGRQWHQLSSDARTSRSRRTGAAYFIPPCTTRCPMPATGAPAIKAAAVVSISRVAAS